MVRFTVVAVMAVIALLAGPMSPAHAGGMGLGPNVAFVCYLISGASPGGNVDLTDQFGARTDVKVGVARLVCAPVVGTGYSADKNPAPPPCDQTECPADHLKCYDIRSSKGDNPDAAVTLKDFFRPLAEQLEETVPVGSAQFLCVGALKTVVSPSP